MIIERVVPVRVVRRIIRRHRSVGAFGREVPHKASPSTDPRRLREWPRCTARPLDRPVCSIIAGRQRARRCSWPIRSSTISSPSGPSGVDALVHPTSVRCSCLAGPGYFAVGGYLTYGPACPLRHPRTTFFAKGRAAL